MNILAISGSLRAASTNTQLLRAMALLAPAIVLTLYDGLAALPPYTPEQDHFHQPALGTSPAPVAHLRGQIAAADGVLFCTPEYAFGVPGSLKNALDWLVSSGELWRKPTAAVSASPGAGGGEKALASLVLTLSALEAAVPAGGTLSVPQVKTKLAAQGHLTDPSTIEALQTVLHALAEAAARPPEE